MNDSVFAHYLKPVPPRYLTRFSLFIEFLSNRIKDAERRATYQTPNGYGCRVMVDILKLANLQTLLSLEDPTAYIYSILRELEKPIDVTVGKHTPRSLFVQSRTPCYELITASRRGRNFSAFPTKLPYAHEEWSKVRPLRIVDMGVSDLRFQVYNERLIYQQQGPTHAIYALDCFALVLKFFHYYKSCGSQVDLEQCLLNYVHFEIVTPSLLHDSVALWLRNLYRQQFLIMSPLQPHTSTIWDNVNIDTIGSDFSGAMVDVLHLRNDLLNQSVSNQTVMSSLPLTVKGQSFTDYYLQLVQTVALPPEQPYLWIDCLRNLTWWETIVMFSSFVPDYPDVISMQRQILRDVRLWLMAKPWNNVFQSIPYRTMIRTRLEGLYTYLLQK